MYKINQHLKRINGKIILPNSFRFCKDKNEFFAWYENGDIIVETTISDMIIIRQKIREWKDEYGLEIERLLMIKELLNEHSKRNNITDDDSKILHMIRDIERLNDNTPNGEIIDSDTILVDLINDCDFEITGISQDIFDIYKQSTDKEAVRQMFYEFTGCEFTDYLKQCIKNISR